MTPPFRQLSTDVVRPQITERGCHRPAVPQTISGVKPYWCLHITSVGQLPRAGPLPACCSLAALHVPVQAGPGQGSHGGCLLQNSAGALFAALSSPCLLSSPPVPSMAVPRPGLRRMLLASKLSDHCTGPLLSNRERPARFFLRSEPVPWLALPLLCPWATPA